MTGDSCAACWSLLPDGARFCPRCGVRQPDGGPPRRAAAATRKPVTVLFCDLVGSTELAARLEPEALRMLTLRYFDRMRRVVEQHGGTVEKFIGDAVMALFGVPVMREDDPRRALAAARRMVAALDELNAELAGPLGVRLAVRIGVNTGPAVVAPDVSAGQALVSGETVNVAARLEQCAGPGEILIGPATRAAAGRAAVTEPTPPLRLKGLAGPLDAHRLLDVRDDAPERLRRFDAPFVGREAELARLDGQLAAVRAEHRARLVTLGGEAGIGKTRLLRTWLERAARGAPDGADRTRDGAGPRDHPAPLTGAGRCRPYGGTGSLAPLAEAVRALLAAAEGTGAAATTGLPGLAELRAGLLRDGAPGPDADRTADALAVLLGALARRRPLVLALDDCQWARAELRAWTARLLTDLAAAPVLLVRAGRPELLDHWPVRAGVTVPLTGLSATESALLAAGLRATAGGPARPVPEAVLCRAEGNPLYLEQLLAMAEGTSDAADDRPDGAPDGLPGGVRALLGARVDALAHPERALLEPAAVLGREFSLDRLAALAGSRRPDGTPDGEQLRPVLARLVERRLLEPAGGADAFRFRSALLQEVVYRGMSKRLRARHHERAAVLLAGRGGGDETVAAHLDHAQRYRTELGLGEERTGGLRRRAAWRLAAAGAGALARADLLRADELFFRARELSRPGDPPHTAAVHGLGRTRLARGRTAEGRALLALLRPADPADPGGTDPPGGADDPGGAAGAGPGLRRRPEEVTP